MDFQIKGKLALVTAASKGLGLGAARALSAEGCTVAICSRTKSDVDQIAQQLKSETGNQVYPFVCDMSKAEQIDDLLNRVKSQLDAPDIVVCNAGGPPPGTFETITVDQYLPAVELSMMSSIRLTYGAMPAMQAKGWGRIVMITSVSVKQPIPHILLSNTARAGLAGFMKTVAREVADTGVTVNAVLPGTHYTDRVRSMTKRMMEMESISEEAALEKSRNSNPMKTMGDADDFGSVVAFLCSQQARFITGENVVVDGGAYAGLV